MYIELPDGMDFSTEFDTYIIAFCPDYDYWFITKKRFFYYEDKLEFKTYEEAYEYFKNNVIEFLIIEKELEVYRPYFNYGKIILMNKNGSVEEFIVSQYYSVFPKHFKKGDIT